MRKDAIEEGQQVWCSRSLLGAMEFFPELWFTYIFAWSTLPALPLLHQACAIGVQSMLAAACCAS